MPDIGGRRAGAGLAAAAMVALGSSVAVSEALTGYPVLTAQAARYGMATVLLYGWLRLRGPLVRPHGRELGRLVALGVTGLAAFNVFLVLALRQAEPAAVGVVVGAVPVVLALLGPLLARSRPSTRVVVGGVAVTVGAAVVQGGGAEASAVALLLALGALASEAAFSLVAEPLLPRLGAGSLSFYACGVAALTLLAAAPLVDGRDAFAPPSATELAAVVYLAVVVTAVAFVVWYEGLRRLGSARPGLFAGLVPISTLATAAAVGTGRLTPASVTGTLIVALGLGVGLVRPAAAARARRLLVSVRG